MHETILYHCRVLWDYLSIESTLHKADTIIVCGGHDSSVSKEAVKLYKKGYASNIVVTGGVERVVYGYSRIPTIEAVALSDVIQNDGVPKDNIIMESKSQNTGENIDFSIELLKEKSIAYNSIILIHKPYATRRAYMLAKKRQPHTLFMIHSDMRSFDEYCQSDIPTDSIIDMVVGEIQRLVYSPKFGWIDDIIVPNSVLKSYHALCDAGFTERLMSDEVINRCLKGLQDRLTIGGNTI